MMEYEDPSSGDPPRENPSFSGLDLISKRCPSVVTFPGRPIVARCLGQAIWRQPVVSMFSASLRRFSIVLTEAT